MSLIGIIFTIIGIILCPVFTLGCVLIHFDLVGVGIFAIIMSIGFNKETLKLISMIQYEASFKRKGSNKLLWVYGWFKNEKEATAELQQFVYTRHNNKGFHLYGGTLIIKK